MSKSALAMSQPQSVESDTPPATSAKTELGRSLFALTDQALVSGASFLTTVLVGRFAGKEQLGLYSLGFTYLVLVLAFQDSLITGPFLVLANRRASSERSTYAGHVLLHHGMLSFLSLIVFALLALLAGTIRGWEQGLPWVLLTLAVVTPCILLREFLRRMAFADLNFRQAVYLDATVVVTQLVGLGTLAALALLGAISAFVAVGAACLLVGLVTLWWTRSRFHVVRQGVFEELGRNWNFGRWLVAGQMVGVVHGFVIYWLLELLIDTSATGLFAACMTILTLSNPLILGLGNALGPRIARVATSEPEAAARALVHRSNLMVGGVLFLFASGVALFGQWFLVRLYGSEFSGNFATLDLLALAFLIGGLSTATDYGLRAAERTDLSFYAGVAGLVVTVGASVPLILFLGVQGGAVGYLLGCLTTSLLRHVFFASITFGPHSEATP